MVHILRDGSHIVENHEDIAGYYLERPQRATDTDILDDGTFLRLRGKKIVGITITNFSKKFKE